MEIKNIFYWLVLHLSNKYFFILSLLFLLSCSSFERRQGPVELNLPEETTPKQVTKPESQWPTQKESSTTSTESMDPKKSTKPKIALVLSGGSLKSYAHIGVLHKLDQAHIPVDYIIGYEWGALMAALYSQKGQVHDTEWKAFKLREKDLPSTSFFSKGIEAESVEKLSSFLSETLGTLQIQQGSIPFACPSLYLSRNGTVWQTKGSYTEALLKCLPLPPYFNSFNNYVAAPFSIKETIDFLRQKGIKLIIFINVLEKGELLDPQFHSHEQSSLIFWSQLKEVTRVLQKGFDEVLVVDTQNSGLTDFESRRALLEFGQKAGDELVKRLIKKYGL